MSFFRFSLYKFEKKDYLYNLKKQIIVLLKTINYKNMHRPVTISSLSIDRSNSNRSFIASLNGKVNNRMQTQAVQKNHIIYFFLFFIFLFGAIQIKAQPLTPVMPQSNATLAESPTLFQWNGKANAINYQFELSSDSLFSVIIFQNTTSNLQITNPIALTSHSFFWRIIASYASLPNDTSLTNKFVLFSPTLSPNLRLWLAANTGIIDSSSIVSQWNDLSGNNFHLTQSTVAYRPIKVDNAIANKPAVKFDGTNDFLLGTTIPNINTKSLSLFIVARNNTLPATGSARGLISFGNYSSGGFELIRSSAGPLGYYQNNSNFNSSNNEDCSPSGTPFRIYSVAKQLNTISRIYVNSTLRNSSTTSSLINSFTNAAYKVGYFSLAPNYWNGNIAEILVYDTLLDNSSRQSVEGYLSNKYAPPVSLGYDIIIPYKLCDTLLTGANQPWFTNWLWSTGDTTSTIRVNRSGSYWVRATNVFGSVSADTVVVNYEGVQTFSNFTICLGDTVTCSYSKPLPYTINWSNGNTGSIFKTIQAGTYTMTLTDTTNCSFQTSFVVSVDSFPVRNLLNSDTIICSGNRIQISQDTSIQSVLWSPGNDTNNYKIIYSAGVYKVTAINSRNCVVHDSISIQIKGTAATPLFEWGRLCNRDTIAFTDLSYPADSIASWNWNVNNAFFSSDQNANIVFDTAGSYAVGLSVISHGGCYKDTSVVIHVNKKPIADFNYLAPCAGVPTLFSNKSDLNDGYFTQANRWYIDSDPASSEESPLLLFPASQNYQVSLVTEATNSCSDSITKNIIVPESYPLPQHFTTIFPPNNTQLSNSSILFQWNAAENAQYYLFELSEDADFSSLVYTEQLSASYTPQLNLVITEDKTYYWRVKALNPCLDPTISEVSSFIKFIPQPVTTKLWLAADTGVTITGGAVSQWNDLSGNDFHLTQSTAAYRPTKIDSTIANKPSISFDGTNDVLLGTTIPNINTKSLSLFIVARNNTLPATGSARGLISFGNYSSGGFELIRSSAGPLGYYQNNSNFNSSNNEDCSPSGTPFRIYSVTKQLNTVSKIYVNSTLRNSSTTSSLINSFTNAAYKVGYFSLAPNYWNGNIAEILVYDTLLDDHSRQSVERYLSNKYAPPVNLGYDIKIPYKLCDTVLTGANRPWFTNWLWSTGDTTSTIRVNRSGSYWVRTTNIFGIESSDTVEVYFTAHHTFADTTLCMGDTLHYSWFPLTNYTLNWGNGDNGSTFTETQAGTYVAVLSDTLGCVYRDTFNLRLDSLPIRMTLGNDTLLCSGNPLTFSLDNYTLEGGSYLWSTGDTTATILLTDSGSYWLQITNTRGCVANDTVVITLKGKAPVAAFTAPGQCFGETTSLSDLSYPLDLSNIIEWNWNFGDASTSTLQNPTHQYANPGIYHITLSVSTDSTCSSTVSIPTVVYTLPEADFTPATGCNNVPIRFNDLTTDEYPITQWNWTFGDAQSGSINQSNLQNPFHEFDTAGTYQVKLVTRSFFGCSDSLTKTIEIRKSPVANFESSNTCLGQPTWFSDSSIYDSWNPITQRWWFYNNESSESPVISTRFDHSGNYPISYIIKSLNGCTDTIQKEISVYANPIAEFNADNVCLNQPIILQSTSSVTNDTIIHFRWSTNGEPLGTTSPVTLQIDSANTYPIQLIVTTAHECTDTLTKNLIVNPIPQAQFSYNYDEHTIGYQIQFTNTTNGGFTYEWYNQSTLFSTETEPQYDFGTEGNYSILLIATNTQGCTDSANATILVSKPIMDIAITNLAITPIGNYRQATAYLMNMSNRNITNLWLNLKLNQQSTREQWTGILQPGNIVPYTFHTQMLIPSSEALMYGCAEVESPLFTEETDLSNNQSCVSLTENFTIINVYPNPSFEETLNLWVASPLESTATIRILSATGKEVSKWNDQPLKKGVTKIKLSLTDLSNGLYIIEVGFINKIERTRFIISK